MLIMLIFFILKIVIVLRDLKQEFSTSQSYHIIQFTVLTWFAIFIYFYKLYLSPRLLFSCILLAKQGFPLWGKKIEANKANMWKKCESVSLSCVQLWDPMECSPPGCSVHGILQARMLYRVVIPLSQGSSWSRDRTQVSCIAGRFFTGVPREAINLIIKRKKNYGPLKELCCII